MSRRRQRQASSVAEKSSLSAKSMIKAKSIAASILNMSENDLADIMEPDQVRSKDSIFILTSGGFISCLEKPTELFTHDRIFLL